MSEEKKVTFEIGDAPGDIEMLQEFFDIKDQTHFCANIFSVDPMSGMIVISVDWEGGE